MITDQPNFIVFGAAKNSLIQPSTEFMRHPRAFPTSGDQIQPQELSHSSEVDHFANDHDEHLLVDLMPTSTSVGTSDRNHFNNGPGSYSSFGCSDANTHSLNGLVYRAPQLADMPWESIKQHQQSSANYYEDNSKTIIHGHPEDPLSITQEQQQVVLAPSTQTFSSSSPASSMPRWSSWSPIIDESRVPPVSGSRLTTMACKSPDRVTSSEGDEHQNEYALQLFDLSESLQTTPCSSSNSAVAPYDGRHRTNSLPDTSISHSDQFASFHSQSDNSNVGFDKYGMPSTQLAVASWLRPHLQNYLLATDASAIGERTVVILTGKVAQKSYGTEKRFLCPPPSVILDGPTWWAHRTKASVRREHLTQEGEATPPKLSVTMSGESETQEGQVDWFSNSGAMVGQTGFTDLPQPNNGSGAGSPSTKNNLFDKAINTADRDWVRVPAHDPLLGGKCQLRQLYINDTDEKRKRVECLVTITLSNGLTVGTASSRPIKVISKPSKKRLSMKNTDSCIHHGMTVSLFNRIRSQTVSTKYLAVSTASTSTGLQKFMYPGQVKAFDSASRFGQEHRTCFTARTGSWDPFVIWLVDTNWVPSMTPCADSPEGDPDEYIGSCAGSIRSGIPYPTPPVIAVKNKTGQPLAIHYNQHVVLQCLTTGLVSPVMIIRKVDRASTVVGGANAKYYARPEGLHGGEYGDEILGDPVSQLHRVALQIIKDPESSSSGGPTGHAQAEPMPRADTPASYLACLNDTVAIHQSVHDRQPNCSTDDGDGARETSRRKLTRSSAGSNVPHSDYYFGMMSGSVTHPYPAMSGGDGPRLPFKRSRSSREYADDGTFTLSLPGPMSWPELGAYWSEDVSDSSVWTIAGTDCVKYTLWEPPGVPVNCSTGGILQPEPMLPAMSSYSQHKVPDRETTRLHVNICGKNFSRDLEVWFGDIRSPQTEYHNDEQIVCEVPPQSELTQAVGASWKNKNVCHIPLLLVKSDGKAVYKTGKDYVVAVL